MGAAISYVTGAPTVNRYLDSKVIEIKEAAFSNIVGQANAIITIKDTITNRVGQELPIRRPYSVLLFCGPNGTGKTPVALEISAIIYGHKQLEKIEMSNYINDEYSKNKLLKRFKQISKMGGRIVMCENIDKSNPEVVAIIKKVVMGEIWGLDFRNFIFILTTNTSHRISEDQVKDSVRYLLPSEEEFANVLYDGAVVFKSLSVNSLFSIIDIVWKEVAGEDKLFSLYDNEKAKIVTLCCSNYSWKKSRNLKMELTKLYDKKERENRRDLERETSGPDNTSDSTGESSRKRKSSLSGGGVTKKNRFEHSSSNVTLTDVADSKLYSENPDNSTTHTNSDNTTNSYNTTTISNQVPAQQDGLASRHQDNVLIPYDVSKGIFNLRRLFVPAQHIPCSKELRVNALSLPRGPDYPCQIMSSSKGLCIGSLVADGATFSRVYLAEKGGRVQESYIPSYCQIFHYENGIAIQMGKYYLTFDIHAQSPVLQEKPFKFELDAYFAPTRNANIKFFVDAEDYFNELQSKICKAKKCIYIADWILSLEIPLVRPEGIELGNLLVTKAEQGVKICILLYANNDTIIPNNRGEVLKRLHGKPNIEVKCQEGGMFYNVTRWSHHQKCVLIDNEVAYLGGLDLAVNRWDTNEHHILENRPGNFPGADYRNPAYEKLNLKHNEYPRMGWHDIQIFVDGEAAKDVELNFVQRWNQLHSTRLEFNGSIATPAGPTPCRIVRSMKNFHCGEKFSEHSVKSEYLHAIQNAKSFIYLEMQYLIDVMPPFEFVNAIQNRVRIAHEKGEPFHIVVILPLIPDNGTVDHYCTNLVMKYQKDTIKQILNGIKTETRERSNEYISFYGLRNHGVSDIKRQLFTEQIYVHAKLLITDTTCIVGSANLNRRSMKGTKDTEICACVYDRGHCNELLQKLIKEHTGFQEPIANYEAFFRVNLRQIASENTDVYFHVFGDRIPEGEARTFKQYQRAQTETLIKNKHLLDQLKGHIVCYPIDFLEKELEGLRLSQFGANAVNLCA